MFSCGKTKENSHHCCKILLGATHGATSKSAEMLFNRQGLKTKTNVCG
jgi:hypothetical protein